MRSRSLLAALAAGALALGAAACGDDDDSGSGGSAASGSGGNGAETAKVSGAITIDGSSTVYPFAQAAAEMFMTENPDVKITVGESGTGGGFEKFCAGETDISNASRPIKKDEEAPVCEKAGIPFSEVQVANDGIAVVTNKDLKIDCMTTAQLKTLWADGKAKSYKDVDPALPANKVSLYGPGTDSGTFDFFTGEINGEEGASRKDYQPTEDDNVTVQGVSGDGNGLGYFGFSYYEQNTDKLNLVGVDGGGGCIKPSKQSIQDGSYKPLSRPLFMYPSGKSMAKPQVKAFLDFVVANQETIAENAKIVPLTAAQAEKAKTDLTAAES